MFWGGSAATSGGIDASNTQLEDAARPSPVGARTSSRTRGTADPAVRITSQPLALDASPRAAAHTGAVAAQQRDRWLRRYQTALVVVDLLAGALAAGSAFLVRFDNPGRVALVDLIFGVVLPLAWVAVIAFNRAYEGRFVGVGSAEFERVFRAFLHLTAATVFISFLSKADVARGYVGAALALALVYDLGGRYAARKWLHRKRSNGAYTSSVLAIGTVASVAEFTCMLRRDAHAGMRVVGACVPVRDSADASTELAELGVPVLGDVDSILESARLCGAHTVAVVSGDVKPEKLRWISWQLEGTDTDLVVAPGLTEIGGRRMHIQPVAGLPLLHVDEPEFTGFRRVLKGAFDRAVAGLALLLLSPVLLGIGLLVRCTSHGPALYLQTRVGRDGRTFRMVKFRSMVVGADSLRSELADRNESAGPMFKIREDPRITRVGRVLRRFSLDELPQLLNVLTGSMSLVGPRPPLPAEVSTYCDDVRRRLLVKPGLTGLWQISGRSDLSWEESVRLDLHYVENWSLVMDLMILWKTGFAVIRAAGAY